MNVTFKEGTQRNRCITYIKKTLRTRVDIIQRPATEAKVNSSPVFSESRLLRAKVTRSRLGIGNAYYLLWTISHPLTYRAGQQLDTRSKI